MDQETIRLIVSVSATVAGVVVTAWFARKNLGRTLEAAESTEHKTWVRNQRQEAYTHFLAKAETVVHQAYSNFNEPVVQPRLDEMTVARRRQSNWRRKLTGQLGKRSLLVTIWMRQAMIWFRGCNQ